MWRAGKWGVGHPVWLSAFKFIALFLALSLPAYFILSPVRELNLLAAWSGQLVLSAAFGIQSQLVASGQFPLLRLDGLSAEFVDLCSGKLELAVLFGIVFASFEKPLSYRLKGFIAGAVLLFAFNAVRIALTLRAFAGGDFAWSALLHDVLFRASLVLVIVTFYAFWYYYGLPRRKPAADGLEHLATFEGVYAPREDSELLSNAVRRFARGRFLDMGCGTGIQGIAASHLPCVTSVTFADASPAALACTAFNASRARVPKPNFLVQSDLFSCLGAQEFDTIAFNPPYLPTAPGEKVDGPLNSALDGGRTGRKVTDRFLRQFPAHLSPRGVLLLVDSSLAKYERSLDTLRSLGYSAKIVGSAKFFFEEVVVIKASRA